MCDNLFNWIRGSERQLKQKQNTSNMHRFLLEIFLVTLSESNDEAFIFAIIQLSMLFNT